MSNLYKDKKDNMKSFPVLPLQICVAICAMGAIALIAFIPEKPVRLVLAPAACAALIPQGLALTSYPGGCVYTGTVRRDLHAMALGEFWVARSAILAELTITEGNKQ